MSFYILSVKCPLSSIPLSTINKDDYMALTKDLPKTLLAYYKTLPVTGHSTSENFKASIDKVIELSITQTKAMIAENSDIEIDNDILFNKVIESNSALKQYRSALPGSYSKLLNNYESMQDFRKVEAWADFREKARILIFRLLTAIGISAIVLTTSFLANLWNIPLSLRVGI